MSEGSVVVGLGRCGLWEQIIDADGQQGWVMRPRFKADILSKPSARLFQTTFSKLGNLVQIWLVRAQEGKGI